MRWLLAALSLFSASLWAAPMGPADARHLLSRTGFGAAGEDIASYGRLSRQEGVQRLLDGVRTASVTTPPADLREYTPPARLRDLSPDERREFQRQRALRGDGLRAWWVGEMLATDSPLTERMTLFWHNHFVSSLAKVQHPKLMLAQNELLRRNALGDFGALLHAVGKDPAMEIYLDSANNRRGQPNENFAREVMELFTLGVGHYSEQDVKEAARAFTGWSIEPQTGDYKWRPFAHDAGSKTVLGRSGNFDGDAVLDILLQQPETAEFIVAKLWREFVSPTPDPAEVKRIGAHFRASGYQIKVALRELLMSPAFWASENRACLVKSPVDLVVGTLRTLHVRYDDPLPFAFTLRQLGQDLFAPPNVKGWPGGDAWINSTTLLARMQFADRLLRADDFVAHPAAKPAESAPAMTVAMPGGPAKSAATAKGGGPLGPEGKARLQRAMEGIHVDSGAWLTGVRQLGLTPAQVLLTRAPLSAPEVDAPAVELIRQFALDPSYQLK